MRVHESPSKKECGGGVYTRPTRQKRHAAQHTTRACAFLKLGERERERDAPHLPPPHWMDFSPQGVPFGFLFFPLPPPPPHSRRGRAYSFFALLCFCLVAHDPFLSIFSPSFGLVLEERASERQFLPLVSSQHLGSGGTGRPAASSPHVRDWPCFAFLAFFFPPFGSWPSLPPKLRACVGTTATTNRVRPRAWYTHHSSSSSSAGHRNTLACVVNFLPYHLHPSFCLGAKPLTV